MSENMPEILVLEGSLKGSRFKVSETGLRLGRSSTCDISVSDPALSRNHCLFEWRDGKLWVTDLASANGTFVNGVPLGADSFSLKPGDRISAGDTSLVVAMEGEDMSAAQKDGLPDAAPKVDLGFGKAAPQEENPRPPVMRLVLWTIAVLAVVGAVFVILTTPEQSQETTPVESNPKRPGLHSFSFEKVEADGNGIYRYALSYSSAAGALSVTIDDVPKKNRHVRKTVLLTPDARARLEGMFADSALYKLDREYAGVPLDARSLKSFSLRVLRGTKVFDTTIENTQEPDGFRRFREQLETFSKNELGIWAIQYSAEKLVEMSAESRRAADAKWEERDVQHGNLAAALAAYNEAMFYLETVEPKPADYGELAKRRQQAADELARRYREQRFLADRAMNLADWESARRELRILCELVPDPKDPRHAEATSKLLDVEARIKRKN